MSTQIIIGILINTVAFGITGFRNQRLGIKVPNFLLGEFFNIPITVIYYLSFIIILFSPEKLLFKIIIALLMQFLINHIIWGIITGIIAGRIVRKERKKMFNKSIDKDREGTSEDWEEFKNINSDMIEKFQIEMIDQFMIPDNLNVNKFAANYLILKNGSKEIYCASAKLKNEPDASEDATPTIDWMANSLNQPVGYPIWFMAAYPDIVKWFSNLKEEKLKLFIDDYLQDCMDDNDKFKLPFLRKIVDEYINDGNVLEVA